MRMFAVSLALLTAATLSAQSTSFQRGDLVRVRPAANEKAIAPPVLRVVAIADDRIRLADATVYVNDLPVSGFSPEFLKRVANSPERTPQVVPAGHCFVMGEQRTSQDVSEYWGQHSDTSLERIQQR